MRSFARGPVLSSEPQHGDPDIVGFKHTHTYMHRKKYIYIHTYMCAHMCLYTYIYMYLYRELQMSDHCPASEVFNFDAELHLEHFGSKHNLLYSTLLYSTLLYSTLLYSTICTILYHVLVYTIMHYTLPYITILCLQTEVSPESRAVPGVAVSGQVTSPGQGAAEDPGRAQALVTCAWLYSTRPLEV